MDKSKIVVDGQALFLAENNVEETLEQSNINSLQKEEISDNENIPSNENRTIEAKAEFPGGEKAMEKFIKDNTKCPAGNDSQDRVVVNFSLDANGNVVNPTIVRGINTNCYQEALRLVKPMPQ